MAAVVSLAVPPQPHRQITVFLDVLHFREAQLRSPMEGCSFGVAECAGHASQVVLRVRVQEILDVRVKE